jgi:hypothetical protein
MVMRLNSHWQTVKIKNRVATTTRAWREKKIVPIDPGDHS